YAGFFHCLEQVFGCEHGAGELGVKIAGFSGGTVNHRIDAAAGFDQAARAAKIDAGQFHIAVKLMGIGRGSNDGANGVAAREGFGDDISPEKSACASDQQLHMRLAGSSSASTRRLAASISSNVTGGSMWRSRASYVFS